MVEFLSAAWLELLDASMPTVSPGVSVRLDQVVGRVRYSVVVADGVISVVPGMEGTGDLTVRIEHDAAVSMARGAMRAEDAIRAGAVRISGAIDKLPVVVEVLDGVGAALAAVRAATVFP